nr:uncharacterized protein LOC107383467 isoform X4 [Nothobranchius furzeri]
MACPTLLCAVFLLYQTQGSSAGTPVFVPTGGDLNLDVSDADFPKTFDLFFWKFKTENVMVTYQPNGEPNIREEYRRRIEVSEKKYSVRLKHLTKGDSGTYVARVTAGKDRILAEYDVTVQDPVSPVDLISDSVSKNSTCNVTAACTTPESSISSSFSNQVSWLKNETNLRSFCTKIADVSGVSICQVKTFLFSIGLIIMVSAVITVHLLEKLKKQ